MKLVSGLRPPVTMVIAVIPIVLSACLVSCTLLPNTRSAIIFRDCQHIRIYAASGQASITITNAEDIASLWFALDPSFITHGPRVASIPDGAIASVGYPFTGSGQHNELIVNIHEDGRVSHMVSLRTVAVSPMRQYCHQVALLCRKYGMPLAKAQALDN
jgi:hypothetical protein